MSIFHFFIIFLLPEGVTQRLAIECLPETDEFGDAFGQGQGLYTKLFNGFVENCFKLEFAKIEHKENLILVVSNVFLKFVVLKQVHRQSG